MTKLKMVGALSSDLEGAVCSGQVGAVSSDLEGAVCLKFPIKSNKMKIVKVIYTAKADFTEQNQNNIKNVIADLHPPSAKCKKVA